MSVKLRSDDKVDRLAHSGSSEWHDRNQSLIRRVDEKRGRLARLQKNSFIEIRDECVVMRPVSANTFCTDLKPVTHCDIKLK